MRVDSAARGAGGTMRRRVRACAAPSLTVLLIVESENEYVRMHASKLETTVRADDGHVCVSRRDGQVV